MTTPGERKVKPFHIARAAATPLLVLGLVVGASVGVTVGEGFLDAVNAREATPFSGMAAFALGAVALAGFTTSVNCGIGLWLFWRRKRRAGG